MNILFVWTGVTSYMADAWRALKAADGVRLFVAVEQVDSGKAFDAATVLAGLDYTLGEAAPPFEPDVIFAGGWRSRATRRWLRRYPRVAKVFCLDMPWRDSPRCYLARFALRPFLRQFAAVYVPGAASARYARYLGFADSRIFRALYAVDGAKFRAAASAADGRRRGFLYVGRYSPEKRVDLVRSAYARYRELGGAWELDEYGQGGRFATAAEMPGVYAGHAALLLASAFDPWPLVMLEAKWAGLEVIASDRCGNGRELVARVVPYGDVEAMAREMLAVERGQNPPPSVELSPYDVRAWVTRTLDIAAAVQSGFAPADGIRTAARLVAQEERFRGRTIVHSAWRLPVYLSCLKAIVGGREYLRMPHGAFSPVYLAGRKAFWKRCLRPLERLCLTHASAVIVTSAAEREWVRAYAPAAKTELVDLKRGFDLKQDGFAAPSAWAARPLRVLYLGREHPLKGMGFLRAAVKRLAAAGMAVELRVESGLVGSDKAAALRDCDVVCLPSLSENFGLVVAEALAAAKAVVTTDGASVWADEPAYDRSHSPRLVYLRGFVAADDEGRVAMLADALAKLKDASGPGVGS